MPFTAATQNANFILDLGGAFDLTNATIATSIYFAPLGSGNVLQYVLQFVSTAAGATSGQTCSAFVNYQGISSGYTTAFSSYSLVINTTTVPTNTVGYCAGGSTPLERNHITAVGLQISESDSAPTAATTVAWADSLTITGSSPTIAPYAFTTAANFVVQSLGSGLATASVTWQAGYP